MTINRRMANLFNVYSVAVIIILCQSINPVYPASPSSSLNISAKATHRWSLTDISKSRLLDDEPDMNIACDANDTPNWFIYCHGKILEAVNYHKLFVDSKDFVDMPLKKSPNETVEAYEARFGNITIPEIDKSDLLAFLSDYFSEAGSELVPCTPDDWQELPPRLANINDPYLREWALELNGIWRDLCKKVTVKIAGDDEKYSLINIIPENYTEIEFIAPGGRFREFYYWDAYWIIKGLMVSGMKETAKRMMRNFGAMIKRFGFIPNGGRVYYLRRSQPPILTAMVYEYFEKTGYTEFEFLREMLPILEQEMLFWNTHKNITIVNDVTGEEMTAYHYFAESNTPRPESYKEDLATAAESGWDFSTRWLQNGTNLSTIETTSIIPVDLNSFMCWNFKILALLYSRTNNFLKYSYYSERQLEMQRLIEDVFYNDTMGAWYDFNIRTQSHNTNYYTSIGMPLFADCYNEEDQIFNFPGGVPASMFQNSGEQWDFPNGWSPLNHMLVEGLRKSTNPEMQEEGYRLAQKWVYGNYKVFRHTKHMWEKYNVIGDTSNPGAGGEYKVQDGFGWTNGVILDLLVSYKDRLTWSEPDAPPPTTEDPPPVETTPTVPKSSSIYRPIIILIFIVSTLSVFINIFI